jgi:hypothetical protein
MGKFRETDRGKALDVSGDLNGNAFNGPIELGSLLSSMPEVSSCMTRNLYRYGTGHVETTAEQATVVAELAARFEAGGHDLQELMLDIVSSDGFRYVAPPTL